MKQRFLRIGYTGDVQGVFPSFYVNLEMRKIGSSIYLGKQSRKLAFPLILTGTNRHVQGGRSYHLGTGGSGYSGIRSANKISSWERIAPHSCRLIADCFVITIMARCNILKRASSVGKPDVDFVTHFPELTVEVLNSVCRVNQFVHPDGYLEYVERFGHLSHQEAGPTLYNLATFSLEKVAKHHRL